MKPKRYYFRSTPVFHTPLRYAASRFIGFAVLITGLGPSADATISRSASQARGGGPAEATSDSAASPAATPATTDALRANAQSAISRSNDALGAVAAMQAAARAAAQNGANHLGPNPNDPSQNLPDVPNGLAPGGLHVAPGVGADPNLWTGANLPTQSIADGLTQVTIRQTAQQALLHWQTFNVGKDTVLSFDQSNTGAAASQSIAFNKINDPSGNPTQILGQIKAQGQVYIVNQNGIIFGGSSQVNVHTLTASALPINDHLINNGLLNNPDQQFLFSGLAIPAGSDGTPAFIPPPPTTPDGRYGDVTVQAGATISTPVSSDGNGGRIALVGANVTNHGTLNSPSGQVILAAGLQVGVVAHNSADPSLRGLDVYIGAVSDPASLLDPYAGSAVNSGVINITRGNAILTGKEVQQNGVIHSTTSVSLNGRIDLLANYSAVPNPAYDPAIPTTGTPWLFQASGNVTLGENSVTRILPEWDSDEKVAGSELALRSQINLQGKTIHLGKGSILHAPNAAATLRAGEWSFVPSPNRPLSTFAATNGQVYVDAGAVINLAGTTNASASVSQNLLTLELRGSELAPAPLQRDGELRGETIIVDIGQTGTYDGRFWVGTPLADLTGYVALIERTVSQLTTAGGTLDISAGGSVVLQTGSTIDVSGGWTNFTGDSISTTKLVSNGNIIDIAKATPDLVYSGIYSGTFDVVHSKWGIVETHALPISGAGSYFRAGYTEGAAGGSVNITAPAQALDGNLVGHTVAGEHQLRNSTHSSSLPQAASLSLNFQADIPFGTTFLTGFPTPPSIIFQSGTGQIAVGEFETDANGNPLALPEERSSTVYLSPDRIAGSGFGSISVSNPEGSVLVPEGTHLDLGPGGSLSLTSSNIDIRGNISAAGGSLSFTALNISPYQTALQANSASPVTPPPNNGLGVFNLAAGATLSTAGLIIDDRSFSGSRGPAAIHAGSISIAAYNAQLGESSTIDVSGGYIQPAKGSGFYGDAGTIAIRAGQDPVVTSVLGGRLHLGSNLLGYSGVGANAGTLSIQAPLIQIGGSTSNPSALLLDPSFFNHGGFSRFNLTGIGQAGTSAVSVAPGTIIEPVVESLAAVVTPTGVSLAPYEQVYGAPLAAGLRNPASISLSAPGVRDFFTNAPVIVGDVTVGEGSLIRVDPLGSVSVTGNTVSILGSIIAPGGGITVGGGLDSTLIFNDLSQARATTFLGANSVLSAAGTSLLVPDLLHPFNRRTGRVLDGGSVSVSGNIVASEGAVIDVSGTTDTLDIVYYASSGTPISRPNSGINTLPGDTFTRPVKIDSNAGSISLRGGQFLFSDATLLGKAGGPSALGGNLTVSSGRFYPQGSNPLPSDVNLVVTQTGPSLTANLPTHPIGQAIQGTQGSGRGFFTVDSFHNGGFDSLSLEGVVQFSGPVEINASGQIRLADRGILFADSALTLNAGHVAIGTSFIPPVLPEEENSPILYNGQPYLFPATHGTGSLNIAARLIDVGSLTLQGIGNATLAAENGDIRGNGTFTIAGDLTLRAGQIYPTSASRFTITAYDHTSGGENHQGSVTIQSSGTRNLPLSAGGTLGIYASRIIQEGTLRAPFGAIHLGWDGTGTVPRDWLTGNSRPFPVTSQLTLGDGSVTSVSGVDPLTGKGIIVPYGISTDGTNWIDPRGVDITSGGLPEKTITLSGANIDQENGAVIDLRGGGDLYAERFVAGLGGPVDILNSLTRFAILPGYDADHAPYAAYNTSTNDANLIREAAGYSNSQLKAGDKIYLAGSKTLPAGYYTLLPARYALLPGAVLVTPRPGQGNTTFEQPEGTSIVSGTRYNGLDAGRALPTLTTRFEVASSQVVRARAQYDDFLATAFLPARAATLNLALPLLPSDSGYLLFQASQSMELSGTVLSQSISKGRGSSIDISTQLDTFIGSGAAVPGSISLSAETLSSFDAESLLIGGRRTRNTDRVTVYVRSGNITLDNAGTALTAGDIVLAARNDLTLAAGAEIHVSAASPIAADTLRLTGNGALVRISADPSSAIIRTGVTSSSTSHLAIGAGASLTGGGLILDSSASLSLDPSAHLNAASHSFHSGKISLLLDQPGTPPTGNGLVLTTDSLLDLQGSTSLSLLSYSSIDIHGTGRIGDEALRSLSLNSGEIRGINPNGGTARIIANNIVLENTSNLSAGETPTNSSGSLEFLADTIQLGANQVAVTGYSNVTLNASRGITGRGEGGLSSQASLTLVTPRITGAAGANRSISAGTSLSLASPASPTRNDLLAGGLGSTLTLTGASISADTEIFLPSGALELRATSGNLSVAGKLDVSGTRQVFNDTTRTTSGGTVRLAADQGNVQLTSQGLINLAAHSSGGNAGTLEVSTPQGQFDLQGTLLAQGGQQGNNGKFSLDTASLASLANLSAALTNASLTHEQKIRVRNGDVIIDGTVLARDFVLSADRGSVTVTGLIDGSGATGGSIRLSAHENLTLSAGSRLTVAATDFNTAGKGGTITLEAGSQINGIVGNGTLDLRTGSSIDLSVASQNSASASLGKFSGKLHLRAPQTSEGTDLLLNPLNATITGASSILAEGYRLYDRTDIGGTINAALQNQIKADGETFLGAAGDSTRSSVITARLLAENPELASLFVLAPGAEIIHRTGNLTLGTTSSTSAADWNLSGYRFGEKSAPGVLTIRAAGNLVFNNAISDGFTSSAYDAHLLEQNLLLPVNTQSWAYRLVAGADLTAADHTRVIALENLAASAGSLLLGKNNTTNSSANPGNNALTSAAVANRFQVIRTGTGDIDIHTGRSLQLLNHFATIYTAGTKVTDATLGGNFDLPFLSQSGGSATLGADQQSPSYPVQYSMAGGNVSITAGQDIEHITRNNQNQIIADSQRQLPNNWLYRRGYTDPSTGRFAASRWGDISTTTWWVDFSNFFQGVGALGGGNVVLTAGNNINNVDAVIPTNARMPKNSSGVSSLIELGGGNLIVRAGNDLNAGIYYVERGHGEISAGGNIITNATRSPSLTGLTTTAALDPATWLPTTLFLGKGGFDVSAFGDVLLGPVANAFLLPPGINNTYWHKSYFSTYAPDSYVNVSSLGGNVTLRQGTTLPSSGAGTITPILLAWIQNQQLLRTNPASASYYQPWLRLAETSVDPFRTAVSLLPGTLRTTSFTGHINLVGNLTLSPAASGTLDLLAGGAINGLQRNGQVSLLGVNTSAWGASRINLSDANPASIPGLLNPFGYRTLSGDSQSLSRQTQNNFLEFIDRLFRESGGTLGTQSVLETKQALHAPGLLHRNDTTPLRLYASTGDISGITLFSPKAARVIAGRDITDIAFYIQNLRASDTSVIAAGRDIIPFTTNSLLRVAATRTGNVTNLDSPYLAGDLQISGPGTLQVLARGNIDLGTGPNNPDGTGTGITSIGNARNPYLPFQGANLILGAGIDSTASLASSALHFGSFIAEFSDTPDWDKYLEEIAPGIVFSDQSEENQARLALEVFYRILRDAGRAYPETGNYDTAIAAIDLLFGELDEDELPIPGNILTRSRDIRTTSGGDISLLTPGGGLALAEAAIGNTLSPPGIITESGGNISIFARNDISIGIGRIFTLRGGNEIIWSSKGNIAAGSSSKTVASAPPTRVIIDPQSAAVQTDLAGLATGGGIGVLATVAGVTPGNVDLIAPEGFVDAGDAGIRSAGNLNIAANQVINAGNISTGGISTGTPVAVSAASIAAVTAATNTTAAATTAQELPGTTEPPETLQPEAEPSVITVEVIGYGGSEDEEEEEDEESSSEE